MVGVFLVALCSLVCCFDVNFDTETVCENTCLIVRDSFDYLLDLVFVFCNNVLASASRTFTMSPPVTLSTSKWRVIRYFSLTISLIAFIITYFSCLGYCHFHRFFRQYVNMDQNFILILFQGRIFLIRERGINYKELVFKIFLVVLWVSYTFIMLHSQCCDSFRIKTKVGPPHWQVQNSLLDANLNQICTLRSHIFLYACSKITIKCLHVKSSFDIFLLLLSGDIETNPGPETLTCYSLQHPNMCPFFRTAIYMIFSEQMLLPKNDNDKHAKVKLEQGFEDLKNLFQQHFDANTINLSKMKKNISRFWAKYDKWGRNDIVSRDEYFSTFTPAIWNKLNESEKRKHSLNCRQCLKTHALLLSKFPSSSQSVLKAKVTNPVNVAKAAKNKLKKVERAGLKTALNEVTKDLNRSWEGVFDTTFEDSFLLENKLVRKTTGQENRAKKWLYYKEAADKIKNVNEETMVYRSFGARMSLNAWDRERMKKGFESRPEAEIRSLIDKEKIEQGLKKPKDHIGSFESYDIDEDLILQRAALWTDEDDLNGKWTELGQECIKINGKIPLNAGQIAKSFLHKMEEEHGFTFTYKGKNSSGKRKIRRSKLELTSGVSFPVEPTRKKLKLGLKEMVESGQIDIGENIVEREYIATVYEKSTGKLVPRKFSVFGRKHTLRKIRIKLFSKYKRYMRLNPDSYFDDLCRDDVIKRLQAINEFYTNDEELDDMKTRLKMFERTRNLQIWHDGSVLNNHGHILFCINVLYDSAVFYTSLEYEELFGSAVNVQRMVETPEIYIIARCRNNDEQLAYVNTRMEDLMDLKNGISVDDLDDTFNGIILTDVMRLFHGDGPATAFEAGNSKGGTYFCPSCDVHSCLTDDISYSYQKKIRSLAYKQKDILKGTVARKKSLEHKTLPFEKWTVDELKSELNSRNVDLKHLKNTRKDLEPTLKKVLKGAKRLPVLLMNNPDSDLSQLGLENYEIALVECMHDIAYHIDNLMVELPNHVKLQDKEKIEKLLNVLNSEKSKKRCCDKRRILLILAKELHLKIDGNVDKIFRSLSEIQRILYLDDDYRTPKEILRLHNSCFEHFILLKKVFSIDKLSAKMTRDKLFGKYMHNLLVHAPLQYRLVSGQSSNVEDEERFFNTIRNTSHSTTNNWPGHIIGNLIVRLQVEEEGKELFETKTTSSSTHNDIHKIGLDLHEDENNSLFTYSYIQENPHDWQSHLVRISDFLIFGEGTWWRKTDFGIEFLDNDNVPENLYLHPKIHHFRSSNISAISRELDDYWSLIVKNKICIPTHVIFEGSDDEVVRCLPTQFLADKIISTNPSCDLNISTRIDEVGLGIAEDEEEEVITDFQLVDSNPFTMMLPIRDSEIRESSVSSDNVANCDPYKICDDQASSSGVSGEKFKIVSSSSSQNLDNAECTSSDTSYVTQEARAIGAVLGYSPLLNKYDHTKAFFKNNTSNVVLKNSLIDMQSQLQTKVLKQTSLLRKEINEWERSFMANNFISAPSQENYRCDGRIADAKRKLSVGEHLLRKWEINF